MAEPPPSLIRGWLLFDVGCSMLDVRCWMFGCWFFVVGFSMLVFGCSMLDVRCWMFDVGCSMLDVRCWMFDVGCSMLDVRCWMFLLGLRCAIFSAVELLLFS